MFEEIFWKIRDTKTDKKLIAIKEKNVLEPYFSLLDQLNKKVKH